MNSQDRQYFDSLLEENIDALPDVLRSRLDEIPVIVEDRPSRQLVRQIARAWGLADHELTENFERGLCGLHTGIPLTERSVEHGHRLPDQIHLFREGIAQLARHQARPKSAAQWDEALYEQIRITLLHEIGHHFGLDEDDLEALGLA